MRKELAHAEHIVRKRSYQRLDEDKLANAHEIVDTVNEKIDALPKSNANKNTTTPNSRTFPFIVNPMSGNWKPNSRDAQRVVDELDKIDGKKGKLFKELSKKDRTKDNRNELITKVTEKKLKTIW